MCIIVRKTISELECVIFDHPIVAGAESMPMGDFVACFSSRHSNGSLICDHHHC
jgi:hypothetical protein